MGDTLVFIPTRGRVDVQHTHNSLPPDWRERTYLVCPSEEVNAHESMGRIAVPRPDSCKYVSEVRDYIVELADGEPFIMADDDLKFARRVPGEVRLVSAVPEDVDWMINTMIEALNDEDIGLVGLSYRGGNIHMPAPWIFNNKIHGFYAVDPKILTKEGIRFGDMPLMEDYHVVLSLLERGYSNKILSEMTWNQFTNTPGGCSLYRTMELQTQAAHRLHELHPEFVRVVLKKPKFAWGGQERHDVTMRWKKAWKKGQFRKELKERRIKAIEAFSNA